MIKSFKDRSAAAVFERRFIKKIPTDLHRIAYRKLVMIDSAQTLADLREPPANRLEALKGSRRGQHSIRINDQFRVCFVWRRGDAYDVEIVDYH